MARLRGRGVARLTPRRVAAALRRRVRRWSRRVQHALPRRHRAWREAPTVSATIADGTGEVVVAGTAELRRWVVGQPDAATVTRLRVVVEEWRSPMPGWSGRLGPLPHVVDLHTSFPRSGRGRAEIRIELGAPVTVEHAVAAVLLALEPAAPSLRPASPEGVDEPDRLVGVATADPIGRRRYDDRLPGGLLHLDAAGDGGHPRWWVARGPTDPTAIVAGRLGEPLDARQRDVLAHLSSITGAVAPDRPALPYASVLAQLAMTGVLLHVPRLAPAVADLLGSELAGVLTGPPPPADPVEREAASVRQRRAALRGQPAFARPPAVTALLLTRRPDRLGQVLDDLVRQTYPELEVVIGLHGVDPTPALRTAVDGFARPVEVVSVPGTLSFGGALGYATRWVRGSLLTKVDDDDRYGPEHVWDLVLARHYSGATVVGKGAEFVYLAPRHVTVRRPMESEVYDRYVAGGTLLLGRGDLEAVGGWRPVTRSVDRALLDRVLAAGGLVYRTHGFGYLYTRGDTGHTWQVDLDQFDRDAVRRWPGLPPYDEFTPTPTGDTGVVP